jgi:hypothetical protein
LSTVADVEHLKWIHEVDAFSTGDGEATMRRLRDRRGGKLSPSYPPDIRKPARKAFPH